MDVFLFRNRNDWNDFWLDINRDDNDRYRSVRPLKYRTNKMICGVFVCLLNYDVMKRSVKYLEAFFANIFNRKRKKCIICKLKDWPWLDKCSAIFIEFWVRIAWTLFKLDAPVLEGQKRQLEITVWIKAFTWCTIWYQEPITDDTQVYVLWFLRATREARNPNLQVAITHAPHVGDASFGWTSTTNEWNATNANVVTRIWNFYLS